METEIIAQRIRAFRKLKGHTQNELAKRIGVSIAVLGAVERGTRIPEQRLLHSIANELGIHIHELTATDHHRR